MLDKEVLVVNLSEFEALAKEKLDPIDYDYYAAGGEDEVTKARNYGAWGKITIWPRFLVDVSSVRTSIDFFGEQSSLPLMVPPMAMQRLAHPDGELGLARAAHAAGLFYCITQQATTKLETICNDAPGPKIFQMYMFKDRELSENLIRRAESSGIKALVITIDSPVLGRRERDLRNRFTPQSRGVEIVNWKDVAKDNAAKENKVVSAVASRVGGRDSGFTWTDLAWVRSVTHLPLVLKGIVHPADARAAVEHGMAAVWVSNHGGRQLDGGPSTCEALPLVVQAVGGRVPVIVDGGILRGSDVVKALALGASMVCVGRPLLWALASGGESGAKTALDMIGEEVRTAMALSGVTDVNSVSRKLVQIPGDSYPDACRL